MVIERSSYLIVSISICIMLGIVLAWWPDVDLALALEDSPLSWLQSSLLVACGCVAGMRATICSHPGSSSPIRRESLWVGLSLLMIMAALDERFMGHERIQELIYYEVLGGDPSLKAWPHALTALYGIVGIGALALLRRDMSPTSWRWCRTGVMVGLIAIALDVAFNTVSAQIVEELLEATAETLFLCGLFKEVRNAACQPS